MQLDVEKVLQYSGKTGKFFSIDEVGKSLGVDFSVLPKSLKIVLENILRNSKTKNLGLDNSVQHIVEWIKNRTSKHSISLFPARILMQDYTGVPAIVDLAAMRDAIVRLGGKPEDVKPRVPVSLVVDHSVQVDFYGNSKSFTQNCDMEMRRNIDRYKFLKWGAKAFSEHLTIVPPGKGICHQVNLEHLATVVTDDGVHIYPDTLIGLDSHTTMVNGLSVLGWGVGGIEAESVMLGQPISMIIPEVVGVRLVGTLNPLANATDVVLAITNLLRKHNVVGKFVEYFGEGVSRLSLADRATIANMAPEYGATCGFFPADKNTLDYLRLTGRSEELIELVEKYTKAQGLWHTKTDPIFTDVIELDLSTVDTYLAGPKRPQDLLPLKNLNRNAISALTGRELKDVHVNGLDITMRDGDIAIAAITSCTNTSNPDVIIAAGMVAKKACELGLSVRKHIKTSIAPGSRSVTEYLRSSGLDKYLEQLGFYLVGYGCTTCIGNSGPLLPAIEDAIKQNNLLVAAVLSGNRNFEGRIHPLVKASYLASPPLVVALAIAGNMGMDFYNEPIGTSSAGKPVYLMQLMPDMDEVRDLTSKYVVSSIFKTDEVFVGTESWENMAVKNSATYQWDRNNLYIQHPPYFENIDKNHKINEVTDANILALLGDSITTDHISPAGDIAINSPAGKYLTEKGTAAADFNTYGARRGSHEVMLRGTFANIRIKNFISGVTKEGGYTLYIPTSSEMSIYDAAMLYKKADIDTVVVAGKEYGSGSSRDWAAKGVMLLGVKAVIAESFERIHRSNLIGMGVLPLEFTNGDNKDTLRLSGHERISISITEDVLQPNMELQCLITRSDGTITKIMLKSRIDTIAETVCYKEGGILIHALKELAEAT